MLTKLLIPIIYFREESYDDNLQCEVIGTYSDEDKGEMYDRGNENVLSSMYSNRDVDSYEVHDIDYDMKTCETECFVSEINDAQDVSIETLNMYSESGEIVLLRFNINPNTVDGDCESELKFWLKDSNKLLTDATLDKETKIRHLPAKELYLIVGDERFKLMNCKLVKLFVVRNSPFNFALLIEKIKRTK